jgi:hypothetical protein
MDETVTQAVDTPAPDANASPETGSEAAPSPAGKPAEKDGFSKRIDELTHDWRNEQRSHQDTARDRDFWRQEAERLRTQAQPKPAPESTETKTLADFEFDERKYQDHLFQQAEQRAVKAAETKLKEQSERETAEKRRTAFTSRESEFAKANKDYFDKTRDPRLPFTRELAEIASGSEDGPAVLYYLANNHAQAEQIARLPPTEVAREIGRIEARLSYEKERAKEAEKRVSEAPPPPKKIEGSGETVSALDPSSPDSDKLSDEEWRRRRDKQVHRKRA